MILMTRNVQWLLGIVLRQVSLIAFHPEGVLIVNTWGIWYQLRVFGKQLLDFAKGDAEYFEERHLECVKVLGRVGCRGGKTTGCPGGG